MQLRGGTQAHFLVLLTTPRPDIQQLGFAPQDGHRDLWPFPFSIQMLQYAPQVFSPSGNGRVATAGLLWSTPGGCPHLLL